MADRGAAVRAMVAAAIGLVVGLALGGLAPRAQLRALQAQVAELEDQPRCEGSGIGREIASAFRGRPLEAALEEDEVAAIEQARREEAGPPPDEEGVHFEFNVGEGEEPPSPEDVREGLQMAKDAMAMRQAQARAALDEQARPTEEQWREIDAAIDRMNDDLKALADDFVAGFADGREPTRRDAMIFAADTLDVLIEADDAIWGTLSEDQRAAVDEEAIDPLSHVDPELLDAFLELDR